MIPGIISALPQNFTEGILGGVMKKLLNIEYACIHANYWMIYGIVSSFASVFLLGRGYSNTEIGIILAAANVM